MGKEIRGIDIWHTSMSFCLLNSFKMTVLCYVCVIECIIVDNWTDEWIKKNGMMENKLIG